VRALLQIWVAPSEEEVAVSGGYEGTRRCSRSHHAGVRYEDGVIRPPVLNRRHKEARRDDLSDHHRRAAALRSGETTRSALAKPPSGSSDKHDAAAAAFIAAHSNPHRGRGADTTRRRHRQGPAAGNFPWESRTIITTAEGPTTGQSLLLDPQWGLDIGRRSVAARLRRRLSPHGQLTTMEFAIGMPDLDVLSDSRNP